MKIIIFCNKNDLKIRIDDRNYKFFKFLQNSSKYDINIIDKQNNDIDNILSNDKESVIILYSCQVKGISKYPNYKIYFIEDVCCLCKYGCIGDNNECNFNNQKNYIINEKFDCIFHKFKTYLIDNFKIKKYKFPYFFNEKQNFRMNIEKCNDILIFGALYPKCYIFRNRLYRLLKKSKYNVKILPYSKKKHPEKIIKGTGLTEEINKSWLTITTKSINNLMLAKYYEAFLCGSVACGDYPDLEDDTIIRDNMIFIDNRMKDSEIFDIIDKALADKKNLQNISNKMYKHMINNYTFEKGVELFDSLIGKIFNS
jgi:hypothetical protein